MSLKTSFENCIRPPDILGANFKHVIIKLRPTFIGKIRNFKEEGGSVLQFKAEELGGNRLSEIVSGLIFSLLKTQPMVYLNCNFEILDEETLKVRVFEEEPNNYPDDPAMFQTGRPNKIQK